MLKEWIRLGKEKGASDLLLEAGSPLVFRIRGELISMGPPISSEVVLSVARELLGEEQWLEFCERRSADLSRTLSGTRCRINVFQTVRGAALAIRLLSSFQNNIRDCNLHPDIKKMVEAKSGLVLISGATGSGKSTTLATLIEEMNRTQKKHIIVVESPIEYFFANRQSFIRQREVPNHTPSFEQAIVDSMRENPDVLVIGEMRTPDVMRLTLNAAETGHLVLATMHSSTCAEALNRICMSFPSEIQGSIRAQLADCLIGVICQRLVYLPHVQLRVPQLEILVGSSGVKATLRSGQLSQIISAIQTGGEEGMWSFDRYQRWMDGKKDWVRPSQAVAIEESLRESPKGSNDTQNLFMPQPIQKSSSVPSSKLKPALPKLNKAASNKPSPSSEPGPGGRIEISGIDEDLEELAKKISDE